MKIIAAYDGSKTALDVLKLAFKQARAFNGEVCVVYSLMGGPKDDHLRIEEGQAHLQFAEDYLKSVGIICETHLLVRGLTPGEDIVQFALENNADYIIVGVRRRSNISKIVFGSTARYVILESHCPVISVK